MALRYASSDGTRLPGTCTRSKAWRRSSTLDSGFENIPGVCRASCAATGVLWGVTEKSVISNCTSDGRREKHALGVGPSCGNSVTWLYQGCRHQLGCNCNGILGAVVVAKRCWQLSGALSDSQSPKRTCEIRSKGISCVPWPCGRHISQTSRWSRLLRARLLKRCG